jgi:hypothetical protein
MLGRCALAALAGACIAVTLAACASGPSTPRALLDENTGVTLNVVAAPLIFARIQSEGVASRRDYVTLMALENDNAGKYTELLLAYRWSVVFHGVASPPEASAGRLLIEADGHIIDLQPLEHIPVDLSQRKDLFVPEDPQALRRAYVIDFDTMRLIAASHELTVRLPQETLAAPFTLWRDGRPALTQFVQQFGHP